MPHQLEKFNIWHTFCIILHDIIILCAELYLHIFHLVSNAIYGNAYDVRYVQAHLHMQEIGTYTSMDTYSYTRCVPKTRMGQAQLPFLSFCVNRLHHSRFMLQLYSSYCIQSQQSCLFYSPSGLELLHSHLPLTLLTQLILILTIKKLCGCAAFFFQDHW